MDCKGVEAARLAAIILELLGTETAILPMWLHVYSCKAVIDEAVGYVNNYVKT